jgi:hypothetical protein
MCTYASQTISLFRILLTMFYFPEVVWQFLLLAGSAHISWNLSCMVNPDIIFLNSFLYINCTQIVIVYALKLRHYGRSFWGCRLVYLLTESNKVCWQNCHCITEATKYQRTCITLIYFNLKTVIHFYHIMCIHKILVSSVWSMGI